MATYMVTVTEEVEYEVPVELEGEYDEDAIREEAERLIIDNGDRDQWCTGVPERSVGTISKE